MPEPSPNVRLQLLNTPENVVLVREVLTGVAEAVQIATSDLNDIRTAVTEACNNVVLHAYRGAPGPMEVEVCLALDAVSATVRDRGTGLKSSNDGFDGDARRMGDDDEREPDGDEHDGDEYEGEREDQQSVAGLGEEEYPSAGIGLHVIETLAGEVKFECTPGGGTEVRMRFDVPAQAPPPCAPQSAATTDALAQTPPTAIISIAPLPLAGTVLPRLVSTLAARAHFSTDRISDAQLLADALAAHAAEALSGDQLDIGVNVDSRKLELHVAPLRSGLARGLLEESELDGLGSVIEKLTDRRDVATVGPYESLTLGLLDKR